MLHCGTCTQVNQLNHATHVIVSFFNIVNRLIDIKFFKLHILLEFTTSFGKRFHTDINLFLKE